MTFVVVAAAGTAAPGADFRDASSASCVARKTAAWAPSAALRRDRASVPKIVLCNFSTLARAAVSCTDVAPAGARWQHSHVKSARTSAAASRIDAVPEFALGSPSNSTGFTLDKWISGASSFGTAKSTVLRNA